jgi:hypothetical protein
MPIQTPFITMRQTNSLKIVIIEFHYSHYFAQPVSPYDALHLKLTPYQPPNTPTSCQHNVSICNLEKYIENNILALLINRHC